VIFTNKASEETYVSPLKRAKLNQKFFPENFFENWPPEEINPPQENEIHAAS